MRAGRSGCRGVVGADVGFCELPHGREAVEEFVQLARVGEVGKIQPIGDQLGLLVDVLLGHCHRQAEDGLHDLEQGFVTQDVEGALYPGRLALEIERQPDPFVLLARILLERLVQMAVDHSLSRNDRKRSCRRHNGQS